MPGFILQTKSLSFSFGKFKAVDDVSLNVPENSIYCFLGPNGAGKTTTIRLLLGLYKSKAAVKIFDKEIEKNRIEILEQTGALVETPSLYDHLSAKDNLEVTRRLRGLSKKRIDEVLDIVDLTKAADKKVKAFSLGMKQRLGLALALLPNPKLLILDEPTNGLDPQGIKEIRELLLKLNKKMKITIFLSSHILSEVEKLATHVGIINKGRLAFEGTLVGLQNYSGKKIIIETDTLKEVAAMLTKKGYESVEMSDSVIKLSVKDKSQINSVVREIVNSNLSIHGLYNEQKGLEEIFFNLTT